MAIDDSSPFEPFYAVLNCTAALLSRGVVVGISM
jgi:hypothetical protein